MSFARGTAATIWSRFRVIVRAAERAIALHTLVARKRVL